MMVVFAWEFSITPGYPMPFEEAQNFMTISRMIPEVASKKVLLLNSLALVKNFFAKNFFSPFCLVLSLYRVVREAQFEPKPLFDTCGYLLDRTRSSSDWRKPQKAMGLPSVPSNGGDGFHASPKRQLDGKGRSDAQ